MAIATCDRLFGKRSLLFRWCSALMGGIRTLVMPPSLTTSYLTFPFLSTLPCCVLIGAVVRNQHERIAVFFFIFGTRLSICIHIYI